MPMNQISTPISPLKKRVRRVCAQPSTSTLEFLRNFARTYTPQEDVSKDDTILILN